MSAFCSVRATATSQNSVTKAANFTCLYKISHYVSSVKSGINMENSSQGCHLNGTLCVYIFQVLICTPVPQAKYLTVFVPGQLALWSAAHFIMHMIAGIAISCVHSIFQITVSYVIFGINTEKTLSPVKLGSITILLINYFLTIFCLYFLIIFSLFSTLVLNSLSQMTEL